MKACKCGRFKVNKDHGKYMPILKSHDACKKDCELNTDFSKNETRVNTLIWMFCFVSLFFIILKVFAGILLFCYVFILLKSLIILC